MDFLVKCEPDLAERLKAGVAQQRQAEKDWWTERREAVSKLDTAAERVSATRRLHTEFARLRQDGTMRGTRAAFVLPALRHDLAERGWLTRKWRPLPEGERSRKRPWGTPDRHFTGRLYLDGIPDDIGTILIRACYWASAPHVAKLQKFYDEFGDHWRGELHAQRPRRAWSSGPTDEQLANKTELSGKIITTGQMLRAAAENSLLKVS